ncbi:hypothetical protein QJR26_14760 [Clostridium baratii]
MKIILVQIGPIIKYPPALAVLQHLSDLGVELMLCTTDIDQGTFKLCKERDIGIINIDINYEKKISPILKLPRLIKIRKLIWKQINKIYDDNTIIWVFSDLALKHLGKTLLEKKFILHMFELSEKTLYYRKIPFLYLDTKKYANKAMKVIQCEYNRAHIAKTWWGLKELPDILPNKPYNKCEIKKSSVISDKYAKDVISKIKNKKIILYQGILSKERPLEEIIKAVDKLGEDYAFVVMSSGENIYKNINSSNYYFIPFITPPEHLKVTSHAYIGVLAYMPTENEYSKLNSLYCAPNKIYEYSMFGIPMIGNDIPGLNYVFKTKECGTCFKEFKSEYIVNSIKEIEKSYEKMSINSKLLYNNTDTKKIIKNILDKNS